MALLPDASLHNDTLSCFIYFGKSMQPTFQAGQHLYVKREFEKIKPFDVVVFKDCERHRIIVHRVLKIEGRSLTTRGDSNAAVDKRTVSVDKVLGRVDYTINDGSLEKSVNSFYSIAKIRCRWLLLDAERHIKRCLLKRYPKIKESKTIEWIRERIPRSLFKIVRVKTQNGEMVKIVLGKKTVAYRLLSNTEKCKS